MDSPAAKHTRGARELLCGWGKYAIGGSMAPFGRVIKITEVG
jgi:hypothetical protein